MKEEIKQKKYRYGYQAFWIVCFLLLLEALLETFFESFAAVPGSARAILLMLLGFFLFCFTLCHRRHADQQLLWLGCAVGRADDTFRPDPNCGKSAVPRQDCS